MQFRLLWRPAFQRVDVQQTAHEVNKGNAIIQLCRKLVVVLSSRFYHIPRSTSAGFMFFLGME